MTATTAESPRREYFRQWYEENGQSVRDRSKRVYYENREADNERKWIQRLERRFGITKADYEAMLEDQAGVCAICGCPETNTNQRGHTYRLAVDHCHETGRVRGLLCMRCNVCIGRYGKRSGFEQESKDYLEKGGVR